MIDKEKKYTISEVSKIIGYDTHVLRYYESDFNLVIPRTKSNRRYYTYKEIERFFYIKELQEKGLTNKQIKLVLDSPEILVAGSNEIAITNFDQPMNVTTAQMDMVTLQANEYGEIVQNICETINNSIHSSIGSMLNETKQEILDHFDNRIFEKEPTEEDENVTKEKDVLICENARLKMKLKEKSYEIAELKDKMKRLDQKNIPFWKRMFSS